MQASLNLKLRKGVRTLRRINNTLASEHFSDGIAYLYQLRSDGEPDEGSRIRRFFGERNITYKRIAEARQIMTEYSRIIGIPLTAQGAYANIRCARIGDRLYRVETVQEIFTAVPPVAVMALSDWDIETRS